MLFVSIILAWLNIFAQQSQTVEREVDLPPIHFRWDKSSHDATYAQNSIAVQSMLDMIKLIGPEKIKYAQLTAYSSPEGVREHNIKLSRDRAYEIRWLVRQKAPDLASKIRIRAGGEGWVLLRARVLEDKRISAQSRERILKILDDTSISDDTRKWRLANRLGSDPRVGDLWQYLLKTHYPKLRSCTVTLHFKAEPGSPLAEIGRPVGEEQTKAAESKPSETAATGIATAQPEETPVAEVKPDEEIPAEPEEAPAEQTATAKPEAAEAEASETRATLGTVRGGTVSEANGGVERSETVEEASAAAAEYTEPAEPAKTCKPLIPVVAVSTNLLYDLTYIPGYGLTSIPSFSLEYYPYASHWTVGADLELSGWKHPDAHKYMQVNNLTLWGRYYFKPQQYRFNGLYAFGSANAARYGIGWNEKGREGEGLGLSLGAGHKWTFGRLFIDAGLALGVFYSGFDSYTWGNDANGWYYYDYLGDPDEFQPRLQRWLWFGPTRLYVSIGIDLFNRNQCCKK